MPAPGLDLLYWSSPEAALLILIGVLLAALGWCIFGVTVVLLGALSGAYLGTLASASFDINPIIAVVAGALVCGLVAVLLKRAAIFIVGGVCGAGFVVWVLTTFYPQASNTLLLVLMAAAFAVVGTLSAFFLKPIMIVATSIGGAAFVGVGVSVLLGRHGPVSMNGRWGTASLLGIAAFVLVAILGMILQFVWGKGRTMPIHFEGAPPSKKPSR